MSEGVTKRLDRVGVWHSAVVEKQTGAAIRLNDPIGNTEVPLERCRAAYNICQEERLLIRQS